MVEAKTHEDRVKLLEAEQTRLADIIRHESRRQTALDRMDTLERDAVRIVQELDNLEAELKRFDAGRSSGVANQEIARLRERVAARARGDVLVTLHGRTYRIDHDIFGILPFGLRTTTLASVRLVARLLSKARLDRVD